MQELVMVEKTNKMYAFLDTNVLIHFPFVNEIDWPKVLTSKQVCLVIAPIVLTELDNVKDGMTKPGRRELAGKVSKFITTSLEKVDPGLETPLPERPNTTVMYFGEDDLTIKPQLRNDKQDDHLIAAMLHFKEKCPSFSTVLIAGDNNCRFRARGFNLIARNPEELGLEKRPLPITEEEKRLRQLEKIIPKAEIRFGQKDDSLFLPFTPKFKHIENEIAKYKKQFITILSSLEKCFNDHIRNFGFPKNVSLTHFSQQKHGVHAPALYIKKDFDLDVYEEWLSPENYRVRFAMSESEEARYPPAINLREWKRCVGEFYSTFQEWIGLRDGLFRQLEYYQIPLELKHIEGHGIRDSKLIIKAHSPIKIVLPNHTFGISVTEQWFKAKEEGESYHVVTFQVGSIHLMESKVFSLDLHINDPKRLYSDGCEIELFVTLSGLNIEPIEEKVKIKLI